MKNRFLLVFLFATCSSFAQTTIKGVVYQAKKPIENVAIYLNNTTIGTTTNENGEFSIDVKEGQYELIVSYLGFQKINYSLNTSTYKKALSFSLIEEDNLLGEIIIKKIIYDDDWKYNLEIFKQEFIGKTKLSEDCKLLNPEVLFFDFNAKENTLTAYAKKPLQIKHQSLGYLVTYELESFIRNKNTITYLGYSRYQELKGGKSKQKRWNKNRVKAYNGSVIHFFKSVINNNFIDDGFIVHQFKRVLNTERPTEDEIKKARELVLLNKDLINSFKKIDTSNHALSNAIAILDKISLPKYKDYLYKSNLKKEDIITLKNESFYLSFDDNLAIVYTKEKEEIGYIKRNAFSKLREPLPQTSSIIPLINTIILDKSGVLANPLDVFYEGYWAYEKFGDSLPLDYDPFVSKQ